MISQLTGTLIDRTPTSLVVDVNGIGFTLQVSLPASSRFSEIGSKVTIPTWMLVKEDEISLFGFADATERENQQSRLRIIIYNLIIIFIFIFNIIFFIFTI